MSFDDDGEYVWKDLETGEFRLHKKGVTYRLRPELLTSSTASDPELKESVRDLVEEEILIGFRQEARLARLREDRRAITIGRHAIVIVDDEITRLERRIAELENLEVP